MKILYSFFDRVAGVYSAPFIGERQEAVIRGVKLAIAQGGNQPWQLFPEDNDLYEIGTLDENTGRIEVPASPKYIIHISEVCGPAAENVPKGE